jgi:hypothetical protein
MRSAFTIENFAGRLEKTGSSEQSIPTGKTFCSGKSCRMLRSNIAAQNVVRARIRI